MTRAQLAALLLSASSVLTGVTIVCAQQAPSSQPASQPAAVEKIDVEKFDALRTQADQVVLDVRTPAEFADGHVAGAINLPISKQPFDDAIAKLDKSKSYLVYCHSGKRSFLASQRMRAAGFEHLLNFSGGIVAWEKAGKPMEKAPAHEPAKAPQK